MLSLPVLLKEHLGLKSGQFFKQLCNKSYFTVLHGQKNLLAFLLSSLWSFLLCVFRLIAIPMLALPDPNFPELLNNFFLSRIWKDIPTNNTSISDLMPFYHSFILPTLHLN